MDGPLIPLIVTVSYCTSSNQCGQGEGGCDSDDECITGLKCGTADNCDAFGTDYDCCYEPVG